MTWKRGEMCGSCAGRKGTEANATAETRADLAECIKTGEPFYCHESVAVPDPDGTAVDAHGNRYRRLPFARWRLCRAWMNAAPEGGKLRLDEVDIPTHVYVPSLMHQGDCATCGHIEESVVHHKPGRRAPEGRLL